MRIAVLVKQVPDTSSDRRFEDVRLVRGEDDVLNEGDEHAVEAAADLVRTHGGEVVAVSMGPEDASDALVRALALGADSAYLLSDPKLEGADVTVSARALAAVLGLPLVSQARELTVDVEHSRLSASRSVDGVDESLDAPFPAVISVSDQLNEPRFPGFKDLKAARMKPLVRAELDDIAECDPSGVLSSVLASGFDAMPLRMEFIEEHLRGGSGEVFPDTGDGGTRLAEFIEEKLK